MPTMTQPQPTTTRPGTGEQIPVLVTGGVDTHRDTHTAVALDQTGRLLGHRQFPATAPGYASLLGWLRGFGLLVAAGIEGTGAYGAGLAAVLRVAGIEVVEVDRPDRRTRRRQGKSDPVDAQAAALTALAGRRTGTPKQRDGRVVPARGVGSPARALGDQLLVGQAPQAGS